VCVCVCVCARVRARVRACTHEYSSSCIHNIERCHVIKFFSVCFARLTRVRRILSSVGSFSPLENLCKKTEDCIHSIKWRWCEIQTCVYQRHCPSLSYCLWNIVNVAVVSRLIYKSWIEKRSHAVHRARGRDRERGENYQSYQISFWKKQDVELERHYLEKLSLETRCIFWAIFCVLFHFDTLSGHKDTNVKALLSKCAMYSIFLTTCNNLHYLIFRRIHKIVKSEY